MASFTATPGLAIPGFMVPGNPGPDAPVSALPTFPFDVKLLPGLWWALVNSGPA